MGGKDTRESIVLHASCSKDYVKAGAVCRVMKQCDDSACRVELIERVRERLCNEIYASEMECSLQRRRR